MTENQRVRIYQQLERLIATLPETVAVAATSDLGVITSRIPAQYRADATRLQELAARLANDN